MSRYFPDFWKIYVSHNTSYVNYFNFNYTHGKKRPKSLCERRKIIVDVAGKLLLNNNLQLSDFYGNISPKQRLYAPLGDHSPSEHQKAKDMKK